MAKKSKSESEANPADEQNTVPNPPLYKQIEVLRHSEHSKHRIDEVTGWEFAREANSILLSASEFSAAATSYPIVFAKSGENLAAYAVTGYKAGENRFVDEDGNWRENAYIPAYVRRYPFILATEPDGKTLSLALDTACSAVNKKTGQPLYDGDKPSAFAQKALDFCAKYRTDLENTSRLLSGLLEADILVDRTATVKIPGEPESQIVGFSIVDEQKLSALSDEAFLKLRQGGLLGMIYCHLISLRSWNGIV